MSCLTSFLYIYIYSVCFHFFLLLYFFYIHFFFCFVIYILSFCGFCFLFSLLVIQTSLCINNNNNNHCCCVHIIKKYVLLFFRVLLQCAERQKLSLLVYGYRDRRIRLKTLKCSRSPVFMVLCQY